MAGRAQPRAALDVDGLANQSRGARATFVDLDERALRLVVEHRPVRQLRQRAELEDQRPHFRRVRRGVIRLSRSQIHVHVRHAGRRIERRQQPAAQIRRHREQPRILRDLVRGKQSAQDANRDLEGLDGDVLVERQVADDEVASLVSFVGQAQDVHRVEGVDWRHQQRLGAVPVVRHVADRIQLVVSPRRTLVAIPRVKELAPHPQRERLAVEWRRGRRRPRRYRRKGGHNGHGRQPRSHIRYSASGSGRIWNFTSLLVVLLLPSMWNGARVEITVPRPFA